MIIFPLSTELSSSFFGTEKKNKFACFTLKMDTNNKNKSTHSRGSSVCDHCGKGMNRHNLRRHTLESLYLHFKNNRNGIHFHTGNILRSYGKTVENILSAKSRIPLYK